MSAILCSACFDRLGCQDVRAIMPLQICDACGQPCLGYLGTPVAQHRCSRCGHGWHGPCAGAELCGDCWRQAQPVLHARVDPSPLEDFCGTCGESMARHFTPCQLRPEAAGLLRLLVRLVNEQKTPAALRVLARHLHESLDDGKRLVQSRVDPSPLSQKLEDATRFMVEAAKLRHLCQIVVDAYGDDDRIEEFIAAREALRAALLVPTRDT